MRSRVDRLPHKRLTALSYAARFWEALDTPISLSCYMLSKYGEHKQLVEKAVNPSDYLDANDFLLDYQSIKLLSRFPYLKTGIDTEFVAKRKFVEAEVQCRETNERFRSGSFDRLSDRVKSVFYRAQRKVELVLGNVPSLEQMDFSFGPGAAYGVRGDTSVFKKVSSDLECTYAFTDILQEFLEEFPGWFPTGIHEVRLVPGSQLSVVPKNAKTGRPICIEPLLNGLYQKGVGSWIRKRLKKFGVNLDDQGSNQKLASKAHTLGLATVDFQSASDTVAYMLVLEMLPVDWFQFLDVARCPRYQADGNWYNFHKFTSMGNAYTFELETLIFYSLACACCEDLGIEYATGETLSVYGDDVIIPQAAFHLFQEVTEACGFTVNSEKSYHQGSFFESCGHDFFLGAFVRPILLSRELNTLDSAFYAANSIFRLFDRVQKINATPPIINWFRRYPPDRDRFRDFHHWVVGCIPPRLRLVGPEGYGDGHLIGSLPQGVESRHPCWDGWWFRTLVERPVRVILEEASMAYALYFTRDRGSSVDRIGDSLLLRDYVRIPNAVDHGLGYEVRSRTKTYLTKVFCNFQWQSYSW